MLIYFLNIYKKWEILEEKSSNPGEKNSQSQSESQTEFQDYQEKNLNTEKSNKIVNVSKVLID